MFLLILYVNYSYINVYNHELTPFLSYSTLARLRDDLRQTFLPPRAYIGLSLSAFSNSLCQIEKH